MKNTIKKQVNKNLSQTQKMFANAINYDALNKALSDPRSASEIMNILKKVRY